jgi:hypothetical protein
VSTCSSVSSPVSPDFTSLVAVHGIKGHPYYTWTHPNGEKWLESYLPKDFPNTRILTFGYNDQVFTSSKGYVTDVAEQLLQHLTSLRRSRDNNVRIVIAGVGCLPTWTNANASKDRPIIFVCHSLGGLVVKKAS